MTHVILKFSVFATLALAINLLLYHVLTSVTPSSPGPDPGLTPVALERLISTLARVAAIAPRLRPRSECGAPALQSLDCEKHTGLTGGVTFRFLRH